MTDYDDTIREARFLLVATRQVGMPRVMTATEAGALLDLIDTLERRMQELEAALRSIMGELGVAQPDYPQPVANAYEIARDALADGEAKLHD